ncbi:MAG: hypothetical protein RLY71_2980 [Pseudomonadota bacterium]|jgi:hypothetical protein
MTAPPAADPVADPAAAQAGDLPAWSERVDAELLPALQRAGLRLDLRAHLLVQTWLQQAGRQQRLPADPADCKAVLLGLTAKTARETALAGAEFDAWCKRLKPDDGQPVDPVALPAGPAQVAAAPARWKLWLRRVLKWLAWTVGVPVLLVVLIAAWDWWTQREPSEPSQAPATPPTLVLDQVKSVAGTVEVDDGAAGRPGAAASAARTIAVPGPSAGGGFPVDDAASKPAFERAWQATVQALEPHTRLAGTHPGWWALVCALLASVSYLLRRERQQVIARLQTRERLREQQVWAGRRRLASGAGRGPWREAARLLRRPRQGEGRTLDLAASVRASVAAAGLFRPVWRQRQRMPGYLVLIERSRAGEPFATLAHELVQGLADQGVALQVYEYAADPRWLRPWRRRAGLQTTGDAAGAGQPATTARVPLASLEAGFGGQGLIVCSDGRSLLDARDGRLRPWVTRALAAWPQRALLTPLDLDSWGAAEDRLGGEPQQQHQPAGAGFLLLPARRAALRTLAQVWAGLPAELADIPGAPRRMPALLRGAALRWLSRQVPPDDDVAQLKRELQRWLGPSTYAWLCASAAYPALSAELTGHLADVLAMPGLDGTAAAPADHPLREARLFALAQLPWFRQGVMPEWLRLALLADLPPGELARVRQALETLVDQEPDARGELPLGAIATPDPAAASSALPGRLAQWRQALHARWRREGLTAGEDADSPLRDVIYLGVLDGQVPQLLALQAGVGLAASLQGRKALSLNPLRWIAAGLLWIAWPVQLARQLWRSDRGDGSSRVAHG